MPPNVPVASSPAASARVGTPQLSATFSDTDATDSGTLSFQLCSDATCTSVVATSTTANLANGATGSWTPTVADGVYRWRVRATDVATNVSAWSTIRTFTLDTTPPSAATLDATPADGAALNTRPTLGATFVDSDATDSGVLSFQICTDSACTQVAASGDSATLTNGGHGTWMPATLADGAYFARVRSVDVVGNASAWSTARSFTLDATAPLVPTGSGIADTTRTAHAPTLSATFADAGGLAGTVSFQLCSSSNCTSIVQNGTVSGIANGASGTWTPSALADHVYYWRMRAQDAVGNQSDWSVPSSFTIDTAPPSVPTGLAPAAASRVAAPQLSATFANTDSTDSGTLTFQLCSDATCATVLTGSTSSTLAAGASTTWTPAALADGNYYWRVRAQDAAANVGAWSTIRALTVDTVAPAPTTLDTPADGATVSAGPSLTATFIDADAADSGSVSFQICSDASCATVVGSGSSAMLSNGGHGAWMPGSLADGTYFARARNVDIAGNASVWSAVRSFTLDTGAPAVPAGSGIDDGTRTWRIPTLTATFSDGGGAAGTISFQVCSSSTCTTVAQSGTASSVASGTTASWTPTGLADGTYYWRVRAQDDVGNRSAWSAPSSFTIDTTPPPAPTVSATRIRGRSTPLLHIDAAADAARATFQVCSDPACAVVLSDTFATPSWNGIEWQPPSLPDGTYYWRAFVEDALGNESAWSATGSFAIDTVAPNVPDIASPVAGARVSQIDLSGAFVSLGAGDTGKIAFQICADTDCASVVSTWWSADAAAGSVSHWTAPGLADGTYFWRAASKDAAGNTSAWSTTRALTLDTTPPAKPKALQATLTKQMLGLRWKLPAARDQVSGYALFVNGKRTRTLDIGRLGIDIPLRARDKRTFAIAAIDAAGNVGTPTRAVAVVPSLVHLTLKQAKAETDARHLVLRWAHVTAGGSTHVLRQSPAESSLVDVGSWVTVTVERALPRKG